MKYLLPQGEICKNYKNDIQWLKLEKQYNWKKASRASQEVRRDVDTAIQFCKAL